MIGYIPKTIRYISKSKQSSSWVWDDGEKINTGITVQPTFPVDPDKPNTIETAKYWAEGYNSNNERPEDIQLINEPFKIQILSLEQRSEGGRAYKVILLLNNDNLYVDLREDVLLDTILNCGINKGGTPNAEFIWGKVGSQMKLIRVGSSLHDRLLHATEEKKKKPIKISDIEIGGVYQNHLEEQYIYLGRYTVLDYEAVSNSRYSTDYYKLKWVKRHIWLKIVSYGSKYAWWKLDYTKGIKSLYNKVDHINLDNWIDIVQTEIIADYHKEQNKYPKYDSSTLAYKVCYYGSRFHFFDLDKSPRILVDKFPLVGELINTYNKMLVWEK